MFPIHQESFKCFEVIQSELKIWKCRQLLQKSEILTYLQNLLKTAVGLTTAMVDVPDGLDDAREIIIYGVESEQIEEENDAYNDLRDELGKD